MPEIRELGFNYHTADVPVPTTTETVVISSGPVPLTFHTHHIVVLAWCQMTTGAGTTGVTPRIRRGPATAYPQVGEANVVAAGAGVNEQFYIVVAEDRVGEKSVEYSLTVEQAGAVADGIVLQAAILVFVL